jgi:hypothetical protein
MVMGLKKRNFPAGFQVTMNRQAQIRANCRGKIWQPKQESHNFLDDHNFFTVTEIGPGESFAERSMDTTAGIF